MECKGQGSNEESLLLKFAKSAQRLYNMASLIQFEIEELKACLRHLVETEAPDDKKHSTN